MKPLMFSPISIFIPQPLCLRQDRSNMIFLLGLVAMQQCSARSMHLGN
jgi:hypothetical protein